jgi:hypothetical protein
MATKKFTKRQLKVHAYEGVMRQQPAASNRIQKPGMNRAARWVKHVWDPAADTLKTSWIPGFMPRPSSAWHRQGSIDEVEARENAGQRSLF